MFSRDVRLKIGGTVVVTGSVRCWQGPLDPEGNVTLECDGTIVPAAQPGEHFGYIDRSFPPISLASGQSIEVEVEQGDGYGNWTREVTMVLQRP